MRSNHHFTERSFPKISTEHIITNYFTLFSILFRRLFFLFSISAFTSLDLLLLLVSVCRLFLLFLDVCILFIKVNHLYFASSLSSLNFLLTIFAIICIRRCQNRWAWRLQLNFNFSLFVAT